MLSLWLSPSNVLTRFDMTLPTIGLCFGSAGTGSLDGGGHCGNAVDKLLVLPALLTVLRNPGGLIWLSFDADLDGSLTGCLAKLRSEVADGGSDDNSNVLVLVDAFESTGVAGVRFTDIIFTSCTVAFCSSSMKDSSSDSSVASPLCDCVVSTGSSV